MTVTVFAIGLVIAWVSFIAACCLIRLYRAAKESKAYADFYVALVAILISMLVFVSFYTFGKQYFMGGC